MAGLRTNEEGFGTVMGERGIKQGPVSEAATV